MCLLVAEPVRSCASCSFSFVLLLTQNPPPHPLLSRSLLPSSSSLLGFSSSSHLRVICATVALASLLLIS